MNNLKNNFKELEREEMEQAEFSADKVKSNINSNLGLFQFIGEIIKIYLPMFANLLVYLTGGKVEDQNMNKRN